ncbi:MAG: YdbL family protein [Candidatus Omnitrophica bacterium]|nr:YdbL family protein [Candidatus Omnitrophota bacterium]MCB9720858.1 YdbL family protein [Candidatus Omnitrophota bacterium]
MRIPLIAMTAVLAVLTGFTPAAQAKDYNIKQMTAEVSRALESRRQRFDRLADLKSSGAIGENNKGYISVLKHDPQTAEMVKDENKDRKVIYQTIAEQNGLADALPVIEEVFARVQRDKAGPGENVQKPDGTWIKK